MKAISPQETHSVIVSGESSALLQRLSNKVHNYICEVNAIDDGHRPPTYWSASIDIDIVACHWYAFRSIVSGRMLLGIVTIEICAVQARASYEAIIFLSTCPTLSLGRLTPISIT